jgi:hypothetical protein
MSLIANFDIASDLQVYLASWQDDDAFIINHSLLGGPDKLSTFGLIGKQIECEVSQAEIETGFTAESNSSFSPYSGTMTLQLRGTNFDSFTNPNIILGRKISLYIKSDAGEDVMLYAGFIQAFDFEYLPGQAVILNITANDFWYYLSGYEVNIPNAGELGYTTKDALEDTISSFNEPKSSGNIVVRMTKPGVFWDQKNTSDQLLVGNAGELIYKLMSGEQGYLFCSPGDFKQYPGAASIDNLIAFDKTFALRLLALGPGQTIRLPKHGSGLVTVSQIVFDTSGESGYCPSRISFFSDISHITNQARVSLASDDEVFYFIDDEESQDRFGTNGVSDSFAFDLDSEPRLLEDWAKFALSSTTKPVINSLTVSAITRSGALDIPGIEYGYYAGLPARVITDFNGANIDQNYMITKTRHTITPEAWIIDYALFTRELVDYRPPITFIPLPEE